MKILNQVFACESADALNNIFDNWKGLFEDNYEYELNGHRFLLINEPTLHRIVLYTIVNYFCSDVSLYVTELQVIGVFKDFIEARRDCIATIKKYAENTESLTELSKDNREEIDYE